MILLSIRQRVAILLLVFTFCSLGFEAFSMNPNNVDSEKSEHYRNFCQERLELVALNIDEGFYEEAAQITDSLQTITEDNSYTLFVLSQLSNDWKTAYYHLQSQDPQKQTQALGHKQLILERGWQVVNRLLNLPESQQSMSIEDHLTGAVDVLANLIRFSEGDHKTQYINSLLNILNRNVRVSQASSWNQQHIVKVLDKLLGASVLPSEYAESYRQIACQIITSIIKADFHVQGLQHEVEDPFLVNYMINEIMDPSKNPSSILDYGVWVRKPFIKNKISEEWKQSIFKDIHTLSSAQLLNIFPILEDQDLVLANAAADRLLSFHGNPEFQDDVIFPCSNFYSGLKDSRLLIDFVNQARKYTLSSMEAVHLAEALWHKTKTPDEALKLIQEKIPSINLLTIQDLKEVARLFYLMQEKDRLNEALNMALNHTHWQTLAEEEQKDPDLFLGNRARLIHLFVKAGLVGREDATNLLNNALSLTQEGLNSPAVQQQNSFFYYADGRLDGQRLVTMAESFKDVRSFLNHLINRLDAELEQRFPQE